MTTYIDHSPVEDCPIPSTYEIGLGRGHLGGYIQQVIDAGWRVETKWFVETSTKRHVSVQFTTGAWSKGTYRAVGGSHEDDFETAFLRAFVAWGHVEGRQ